MADMHSDRTAYAKRKPRTVDPDLRLTLVDEQIGRLEALLAERIQLLEKAEALVFARQGALETTQQKLKALREKRDRILSLKERRARKPLQPPDPAKAAERAELSALREKLKISGKSIDEVLEALK